MIGADARSRHKARRGLAIFFANLVPLSAIFEVLIITTGDFSWLIPLVWVPALASVVARLVLREGFSDVSFRSGDVEAGALSCWRLSSRSWSGLSPTASHG
jgi:hypothetical protein